ncbi:MAG: Vancomycin B-type resistance protein VanW [Firmicutes bacterium ADurb.Bin182]|nr:MAG: Vancomycin B-type resistance protein VanW [Firmicutes bacterium ADurb.Bin182]
MKLRDFAKKAAIYSVLAGFLFLCGCSLISSGKKIMGEKISIDGIDVSLMDFDSARAELLRAQSARQKNWKCTVSLDGVTKELTGDMLPVKFNSEEVLNDALNVQNWQFLDAEFRRFETRMSLDTDAAAAVLKKIKEELDVPFKNATAKYNPETDGKFDFTGHVYGKSVSIEKIAQMINSAMLAGKNELAIEAPFEPVEPEYTEEMARTDNSLISTYTTSFAKSPHNAKGRVFNINKAAGIIDGYILKPGEEFNMNKVLGPRTEETGWEKAPGIRYGKYEMEYGGGVCQVSSTLFNTVMMADLKITDRRPHSWPLTYVPIGRDATISTDGPNFKFVNNTDSTILISASVDNKEKTITMEIYGQPLKDGIYIRITSERIATIANPGSEIILDRSLAFGTRIEDRESRSGKKSVTYKEYYDKNGKLIDRVVAYEDTYPAIKGRVYVSEDIFYGYDKNPKEPDIREVGDPPGQDIGGQVGSDLIFGD